MDTTEDATPTHTPLAADALALLEKLYSPNVPAGNFAGDVRRAGRNDGIKLAALALGLCSEGEWDKRMGQEDQAHYERSEAAISRAEAADAERQATAQAEQAAASAAEHPDGVKAPS